MTIFILTLANIGGGYSWKEVKNGLKKYRNPHKKYSKS